MRVPERYDAAGMPRIRDVKTETEGNDATVVESLVPLIERSRPFVSAEVCTRTPASERAAFLRRLRLLDYRLHVVESEARPEGEEIGEDDVMRWSPFDVFAVPVER